MTSLLAAFAQVRRSNLAVSSCSAILLPHRPCFGFSWHQSAASSSDSAPSASISASPDRDHPESTEGLRGTAVLGNLKRTLAFGSSTTHAAQNAKLDSEVQEELAPPTKSGRRLNNKCIAFIRSCLGLKSKSDRGVDDVVFLAIDTEGSLGNLTELGISTFDTRDIKGLEPDSSALEWSRKIKPKHFRFIAGQRYPFLFGEYEHRVALGEVHPYLKLQSDRLYVLVGHDLNYDIEKVASVLKVELRNKANIVAIVDTYALSQQSRKTLPGRLSELWRFLATNSHGDITPADIVKLFSSGQQADNLDLDINHAFHNAGNDAFYNMHTLLLLALHPELLREPQDGSSLNGVFLAGRSAAWQLVRRSTKPRGSTQVEHTKRPLAAELSVRRP